MSQVSPSRTTEAQEIERNLVEQLERILKGFGYELWSAVQDPAKGIHEFNFVQTDSPGQDRRHFCTLHFA